MLNEFETVTLDDLDDSLFKNRYETKYLFSPSILSAVLEKLTGTYRILTINNNSLQKYESLYFDTRKFKFYLDHQNGKLNRYKVRFRRYPGSESVFLEVKFKSNKNQTRKWREKTTISNYCFGILNDKANRFLNNYFENNTEPLLPRFQVSYSRLTLIHKKNREKVTIDFNLSYFKDSDEVHCKNMAIAEVKQERQSQGSDFFKVMRDAGVTPTRFSKYCFGVYRFYPTLKYNRFKQRYLFINTLQTHAKKQVLCIL
ncbi:MAG: polyphosphate polymerase domain-containing protein [bacterium]|nr:polyphosphate polymerase domain-containing protein [bacterium]